MKWRRQDKAVIGKLTLSGGRPVSVVLVADRHTPRSAAVVVPRPGGEAPMSVLLEEVVEKLDPADLVEALCMQERCFGTAGLEPPAELAP